MKVTRPNNSTYVITYEPGNFDPLVSPCGKFQLLACDKCNAPQWEALNVVCFVCAACANVERLQEQQYDLGVQRASEERLWRRANYEAHVWEGDARREAQERARKHWREMERLTGMKEKLEVRIAEEQAR